MIKLKNKEKIIAYGPTDWGYYVLCSLEDGKKYVTWEVDFEGYTYSGHYFNEYYQARSDWLDRLVNHS